MKNKHTERAVVKQNEVESNKKMKGIRRKEKSTPKQIKYRIMLVKLYTGWTVSPVLH